MGWAYVLVILWGTPLPVVVLDYITFRASKELVLRVFSTSCTLKPGVYQQIGI